MADLIPGENFVNGQQVDDTRLNNHVAGARLTSEAISSRDLVPAKAMQVGDLFLVKDDSDQALRSAKLEDIRESNLPLKASTLQTTGISNLGGNTTIAGTLDTVGNINTSAGNITASGSITATGALGGSTLATSGNASVGGTLTITGNTTFNGTVTGVAQIKEILEYTILKSTTPGNITAPPYSNTYGWTIGYQSLPVTKPANEIWIIESEFVYVPGDSQSNILVKPGYEDAVYLKRHSPFLTRIRVGVSNVLKTVMNFGGNTLYGSGAGSNYGYSPGPYNPSIGDYDARQIFSGNFKCVIPASTTWTDQYIAFEFSGGAYYNPTPHNGIYQYGCIIGVPDVYLYPHNNSTSTFETNKLRITKYKTN